MKNKTTAPSVAPAAVSGTVPAKPLVTGVPSKKKRIKGRGRVGRRKEKTQISVRIDKAVMDLAYEHIGSSKDRITDFIERGLILAMQEKFRLPPICSQVRFLATHAPREINEGAEAYFAMTAWKDKDPLIFELIQNTIDALRVFRETRHEDPRWQEALAAYGYPAEPAQDS